MSAFFQILLETLPVYLMLGVGVGICSGMLGLGGGVIIVPTLALVFPLFDISPEILMQLVLGTSLAIIAPTSLASAIAHHRRRAVLWPVVKRLVPSIIVGTLIGAYIADFLPSAWLEKIFGIFIAVVMGRSLFARFSAKQSAEQDAGRLPGPFGMNLMGLVIGSLSSVLGIGGGSITIPFLTACRVDMRNTIACSATCGLFIAISASIGFLITGWGHPSLPDWSTGFIYWPAVLGITLSSIVVAPIGARLAHTLPTGILKLIIASGLIVMGLRMIFS